MKLLKKNLQIAIDGPVGAGKSVGAYYLAKKLNIAYIYTGAMYRATAFIGIENGIDLKDELRLIAILKKTKLTILKPSKKKRVCDVFVNGRDVTDELFSSQMHWGSSVVATLPKIRKHLVKIQQQIAENQAVVMEGRDVTTVVLPQADLKIYMTADIGIRAKRRLKDLFKRGEKKTLKEVTEEIIKRDYQDSHRRIDPLQITADAWVLDTTGLSVKQEIEMIIKKLKEEKLII